MDPNEDPASPSQGVPGAFRLPTDSCIPNEALTANGTENYYPEEGCEPPPPTYPPPTQPASINYPPYSDKPSFTVSWGASNGSGLYVTYELEEQQGSGIWQRLYQGGSLAYTVSGRGSATYRYRVRGCSYEGCGTYFTGPTVLVNLPPYVDLYSEYPFLNTHDQQNAAYIASTQGFGAQYNLPQAQPVFSVSAMGDVGAMGNVGAMRTPPPIVDGIFHLGQGFNLLKEEYSQICIDTNHPDFQIVSSPKTETYSLTTRSVSTDHLRQLLDVSLSGGLDVTASDFSLGASADKKRFVEKVADSYRESIVVKWSRQFDQWTLNSAVDPLKPEFVSQMLIPNNPNAAARFRERCGDKYVHGLVRGIKLYMVFQFDAKRYSLVEREQNAAQLKIALENVFTANWANSVSQETEQLLTRLGVTVEAFAVGGDESIRFRATRGNFAAEYNAFLSAASVTNSRAVEQFLSHYDHPTQFLNYNYFQIFADYRVPLDQVRRWNALDMELAERCELFNAYKDAANYQGWIANCRWGVAEVMNAKSRCKETLSWSDCAHPSSYYTITSSPVPQGSHLHSALSTQIPSLERASVSGQYYRSVHGGVWNKKCVSGTDSTCLPSPECAVDKFRTDPKSFTEGYRYTELQYVSPGSGGSKSTYFSGICLNTYSNVCTERVFNSYAVHNYEQEIYGQCPQARPFAIIP